MLVSIAEVSEAVMSVEHDVARHYTTGQLEQSILSALSDAGLDPEKLSPEDLSGVDEFHIGGRQASLDLFAQVGAAPGTDWIDIGCGIGGPARTLAVSAGCAVTGIDLTDEFIAVATSLTRRTGLDRQVRFRQGSALDLPFAPGSFDGGYMIHVGMNIADKATLFASVHRVLRAGSVFAIYDIMRMGDGDLTFPLPWAALAETSFVATPAAYRHALQGAGFSIEAERSRSEFAVAFFREQRTRAAEMPAKLDLRAIMGPATAERLGNAACAVEAGLIAPVEMITRAA